MQSILIVCHAWHEENFGGAFKLAAEFAQYLGHCGHDVHFLCGTDHKEYSNPTKINGIKLWRYQFPKAPSPSSANLWGHLYGTWLITKEIASQADIGYLNGHSPLQFLAACYALKHKDCRKVCSVHSPFTEELKENWGIGEVGSQKSEVRSQKSGASFKREFALSIVRQLEKMIYHQADKIQCYSDYSLSLIKHLYNQEIINKAVICPGWVDLNRFQPSADRNDVRKKLGEPWKIGTPTFLSVRRLERRMGLDNLIAASSILKSEGYQFQVMIGGTGPLQNEFEYEISKSGLQEYVYLLGRISEQNLPLTYAAADCFVLPTRALECFGLIVLEAFACNTPVIATPVGSIPELMGEYGRHGWLCSDISAAAIADRMRAFLKGELKTDGTLRNHAMRYSHLAVPLRLKAVIFR